MNCNLYSVSPSFPFFFAFISYDVTATYRNPKPVKIGWKTLIHEQTYIKIFIFWLGIGLVRTSVRNRSKRVLPVLFEYRDDWIIVIPCMYVFVEKFRTHTYIIATTAPHHIRATKETNCNLSGNHFSLCDSNRNLHIIYISAVVYCIHVAYNCVRENRRSRECRVYGVYWYIYVRVSSLHGMMYTALRRRSSRLDVRIAYEIKRILYYWRQQWYP